MKKAAWEGGIFQKISLLILVLALLVGDAAAGLAGRLAGGLALAAAAVLGALAQIAGLDGLNMLHGKIPPGLFILFIECTMFCRVCQSVFAANKSPLGGRHNAFSRKPFKKFLRKSLGEPKNSCSDFVKPLLSAFSASSSRVQTKSAT